jgi:hypothetical protein
MSKVKWLGPYRPQVGVPELKENDLNNFVYLFNFFFSFSVKRIRSDIKTSHYTTKTMRKKVTALHQIII